MSAAAPSPETLAYLTILLTGLNGDIDEIRAGVGERNLSERHPAGVISGAVLFKSTESAAADLRLVYDPDLFVRAGGIGAAVQGERVHGQEPTSLDAVAGLLKYFTNDRRFRGFCVLHSTARQRPPRLSATSAVVPTQQDPILLVDNHCIGGNPGVVVGELHRSTALAMSLQHILVVANLCDAATAKRRFAPTAESTQRRATMAAAVTPRQYTRLRMPVLASDPDSLVRGIGILAAHCQGDN